MRSALLAIAFVPAIASADPLAFSDIDLGAPFGRTTLGIETTAGGALRLTAGARTLPLGPAPAGRLSVTVERVLLADAKHLAHVTVRGDTLAREALVGADARGALAILWQETTGLRGDPGERSGFVLTLDDWSLPPDGKPDPIAGVRAEQVRVCGSDRGLLAPMGFNPAKRAFQSVELNPFRGREPVAIVATSISPGPTGAPLMRVATWTATSASRIDGGSVDLVSPGALGDGDAATAWRVPRPTQVGHFVTAAITAPIALRAISVAPLVRSSLRGEVSRAKTLLVSTEAGVFRTILPETSGDGGGPFWLLFPEPQRTTCLSIVLGETLTGRGAAAAETGLADVAVYTDLDFGAGLEALVADLGSDERSDAAMRILAQLGAASIPHLDAAAGSDAPAVRRRAAQTLGRIREIAAARVLVRLVGDADPEVAEHAMRAVAGLGEIAKDAVAEALTGEPGPVRAGAAAVLGQWANAEALTLLVPQAGRGTARDRAAIRAAIRSCLATTGDAGLAVVLARLDSDRADDVALDLLRSIDLDRPAAREAAKARLGDLVGAEGFATRWLAIRLAGDLCALDGALEDRLVALLGDDDEYVRAEAAGSIGRCRSDVSDDLGPALSDRTARVRRAAAEAFIGRGKIPRRELRRLFRSDFWPMVRAAALLALASDPRSLGDEDLVGALHDDAIVVRRAGVDAIGTVGRRRVWEALVERMEDREEDAIVRAESATALGAVCADEAAQPLAERVRRALEPMSDPDQRVGAAALAALVHLGGQRRREARNLAALETTPDYLKAAVRIALREPECPQ